MFSDFIKHYNIIRGVLRDLFLYGCFSREELESKSKVSARKISYEVRRIQQYVEKRFIKVDRDGRYKLLSLTYDSITNTQNFLVNTYKSKSFTRTDLILYYYILMCLSFLEENKGSLSSGMFTFKEIEGLLIDRGLISYDNLSGKTLERKLNEMSSKIGVLSCRKEGRTKYYKIADDIFRELNDDELKNLYLIASLYKNILFPVTAGYFLCDTLKDYMKYERKINFEINDCFQYKNLHFHPVIEEEILWQLMNAINEKKLVTLVYNFPKGRERNIKEEVVKPYKIRYDISCGRFYLISFNKLNKLIISRLDRIDEVIMNNDAVAFEYTGENDSLKDRYKEYMEKSWSSVPLKSSKRYDILVFEIIINEPSESYIIDKIKSELGDCKIEKIEAGHYRFETEVNDSIEMIPYLRSYSGYIRIISSRHIKNRLINDWKEMLSSYGAV